MDKTILSVSVQPINPDIVRGQKLAACEIAYCALMNRDEPPLRWFTTSMLRLPATWTHVVGMCLWKPNSKGVLGWKSADNPFGYVRVAARLTALRWNPELVFGCNAERVLHPKERNFSGLKFKLPEDSGMAGEPIGHLAWHGAAATKRNGRRSRQLCDDPYNPRESPDDELQFYIIPELCFESPREGLYYDWDTIGSRAGLDVEEVALLKARFQGYTRTTLGRFLKWDEHQVQAVWRRVNRRLDDKQVLRRLEKVLVGEKPDSVEERKIRTA